MDKTFSIRDLEKRKQKIAKSHQRKSKRGETKSYMPEYKKLQAEVIAAATDSSSGNPQQEKRKPEAGQASTDAPPNNQQQESERIEKTKMPADSAPNNQYQENIEQPEKEDSEKPSDHSTPHALPQEEGIDYRRYMSAIADRKAMVIAIILGFFLSPIFLSLNKPSLYEAKAKILRKRGQTEFTALNISGISWEAASRFFSGEGDGKK